MFVKPLVKAGPERTTRCVTGRGTTRWCAEVLLARAHIVSEGGVDTGAGRPVYTGSTMVRIPVSDVLAKERLSRDVWLQMVAQDGALRLRLLRTARQEAERRAAPYGLSTVETETSYSLRDGELCVDIDVAAGAVAGDHRTTGT